MSSASAIGFLLVPFAMDVTRPHLRLCAAVLAVQGVVSVAGFAFHLVSVVRQPGATWFERTLNGAPPLAPLLFPNLVVLGWIALWVLALHLPQSDRSMHRSTIHDLSTIERPTDSISS